MPFEIAKQATAAVMAGSIAGAPVPENIQSVTPIEVMTYETVAQEHCVTEVYKKAKFGFRTELEYVPVCTTTESQQPVYKLKYRVVYLDNNQVRVVELDQDPRL